MGIRDVPVRGPQREHARADGQNRPVGGIVVGGRSGRRGDEHTVADQFLEPHPTVNRDTKLGCLRTGAQEAHLVDRQHLVTFARHGSSGHGERVEDRLLGGGKAGGEVILGIGVHQEAHCAAVHAVDRNLHPFRRMQRLEHEAVAAERDHDFGPVERGVAVARDQPGAGLLGEGRVAGGEGDAAGRHGGALRTALLSPAGARKATDLRGLLRGWRGRPQGCRFLPLSKRGFCAKSPRDPVQPEWPGPRPAARQENPDECAHP